jgi:RNA polymerase sigma-70 factor (ECF subfamily)
MMMGTMSGPEKELQGDKLAAFEKIFEQYESPLLRYAEQIVRNGNTAQDIVQEVFLRLIKSYHAEFVPGPLISSWLYRVTHNCAVDHIRKNCKVQTVRIKQSEDDDSAEDIVICAPAVSEGPSEQAEQAVAALRKLSVREQQLVILKVYEEKSYKEISEITGITTTNVGYILHNAMKKLAEELKKAKAL